MDGVRSDVSSRSWLPGESALAHNVGLTEGLLELAQSSTVGVKGTSCEGQKCCGQRHGSSDAYTISRLLLLLIALWLLPVVSLPQGVPWQGQRPARVLW